MSICHPVLSHLEQVSGVLQSHPQCGGNGPARGLPALPLQEIVPHVESLWGGQNLPGAEHPQPQSVKSVGTEGDSSLPALAPCELSLGTVRVLLFPWPGRERDLLGWRELLVQTNREPHCSERTRLPWCHRAPGVRGNVGSSLCCELLPVGVDGSPHALGWGVW